jgi:glycosyltransferase involved in cell wall biosynthesis
MTIHPFRPRGLKERGHLWWIYPGLTKLVKDLDPDVIHVTAETYGIFFSQVDLRRRRVAGHVVDNIWTHGSVLERSIRLSRARHVLGRLAGCASWNQAGLELAHRFGLSPDKPTAVFPARIASPAPFREAAASIEERRASLGPGDRPAVGYLGRLVPEKGVAWLLESFARSRHAGEARLLIYGEGPDLGRLQRLASHLGLSVHFGGAVPPAEVPRALAALDILVVPSLTTPAWAEQFGRVIVEAMFAGTPVIASDSGSIPEVVGDAGVLVPEGDRDALAGAIDRLLENPERRAEIGSGALSWAMSHYSPDVLGARIFDFWQRVGDVR